MTLDDDNRSQQRSLARRLLALAIVVLVLVAGAAFVLGSRGGGEQATGIAPPATGSTTAFGQTPTGPTTEVGATPGSGLAAGRFTTLPPGSTLPTDEQCAARVRADAALAPLPEIRPDNAKANATPGHPTAADPAYPLYARVTGSFTGTTEEILRWAACKWGIDEDVVRAQAAKESYWFQKNLGDFGTDPTRCLPGHTLGSDGQDGKCPESVGITQVRYPYFQNVIGDAITSTAYNLDVTYAVWRTCFEGNEPWLDTVEKGQSYTKGDLWGCVGRWFAGRWYTDPAKQYISAVQDYQRQGIWKTQGFIDFKE